MGWSSPAVVFFHLQPWEYSLKYLGLFQMDSAVLTVLNSDILPHISTGAGTRRLPILHVVNTRDVFWAIPWILNVQRRPGGIPSRLAPDWTLGSAGPIVKLGTADITKEDHENLIVIGTPEASAASDAQLLSDQSRFSPCQPQMASRVIPALAPTCNQLDKK